MWFVGMARFAALETSRDNGRSQPRSSVDQQVAQTIEKIRPAVQADGGDIFLRGVDADTGVVTVELVGACVSCPSSTVTLKAGVERILKDRVPGVTEVRHVDVETAVSL